MRSSSRTRRREKFESLLKRELWIVPVGVVVTRARERIWFWGGKRLAFLPLNLIYENLWKKGSFFLSSASLCILHERARARIYIVPNFLHNFHTRRRFIFTHLVRCAVVGVVFFFMRERVWGKSGEFFPLYLLLAWKLGEKKVEFFLRMSAHIYRHRVADTASDWQQQLLGESSYLRRAWGDGLYLNALNADVDLSCATFYILTHKFVENFLPDSTHFSRAHYWVRTTHTLF